MRDKQPPLKRRLYQRCSQRCSWYLHMQLSSNQPRCREHQCPPAHTSTGPGRLTQIPAVVSALPREFPFITIPLALRSHFIPALLRESWSIPDTLLSPLTTLTHGDKIYMMGVPVTAWRHSLLPPGSLQAEVQTQNVRRAYFVQFPWDRILAWLLIRSIVL